MTKKRKTVAKIVELVARKKCMLSWAVGPIDIKGSVGRHPFIRLTSIIINYLMETCAIMMNYGHAKDWCNLHMSVNLRWKGPGHDAIDSEKSYLFYWVWLHCVFFTEVKSVTWNVPAVRGQQDVAHSKVSVLKCTCSGPAVRVQQDVAPDCSTQSYLDSKVVMPRFLPKGAVKEIPKRFAQIFSRKQEVSLYCFVGMDLPIDRKYDLLEKRFLSSWQWRHENSYKISCEHWQCLARNCSKLPI
jgi:hypothetical protein